ncbi:MAG TPA: AMP-binding protein [Opitutaceae bacterium]|nr:AMP-binding protein [Opitutaceae bacterium]
MLIGDLLTSQARAHPDTPALLDPRAERSLTFAELDTAVTSAATWWQTEAGLQRGDAVLVFVPMSADLYVALLGLFRIGAVALFLDPSAGKAHLEACCARWAPKALLAVPKAHLLRLRSPALRKIPLKLTPRGWLPFTQRWRPSSQISNFKSHISPPTVHPSDPALVTFTSGSTGLPKAAVRTHALLLAQYHALAPSLHLNRGDIDLATLPIFVLANLAAGVTTVLPEVDLRKPGEVDAAGLFAQIERDRVTRITASPAFFERLITYGLETRRTLPSLRQVHTGGAPVFPRLLDALRHLAPNAQVVAVYGSTEAEPIAHLEHSEITPDDLTAMASGRGLLAGQPTPEIRLAIIADEFGRPRKPETTASFHEAKLPVGAIGEIVVAGDHVLKGYLGGHGDEETKFKVDGETWHRTGDAGSLDAHGRLWLNGCCTAKIDDAHGRLYPFGIECIAMTFPDVRRAAFVSLNGQRLLAIESSKPSPELETQLTASATLANAYVEKIIFLDHLPVDRRHNAKIDYPALQALLQSSHPSS